VVLVHGNFASKRWFSGLLAAPPAGARLLALDLPNFGDSDPLGAPITIAAYAAAVRGFVRGLADPARARPVLVGHSLGGAVVLAAAAADPDAWSALVLVDGSAPEGLVTPEEHYPLLDMFQGNAPLLKQALAPLLASRQPPTSTTWSPTGCACTPTRSAATPARCTTSTWRRASPPSRPRAGAARRPRPADHRGDGRAHRGRLHRRGARRPRDLGRRRPQPRDRGPRALRGAPRRAARGAPRRAHGRGAGAMT
jgi:pimeloyl-ACP methyl ester carboxylesterase